MSGPKVNYVIAAWSGPRRDGGNGLECLKKQIRQLGLLRHRLSQVTVVVPDNPDEPQDFRAYVENPVGLANEAGGTPVQVLRRSNFGLSYGSWDFAYNLSRMSFDYYILTEDDYYFVEDHFDTTLTRIAAQKGGYVCGFVSERNGARWPGNSVGACSSRNLEKVCQKYGRLPSDTRSRGGGYIGEGGQVLWGRIFGEAGVPLADITDEYACLHWYWQHQKCLIIPGQKHHSKRYLYVPFQATLGHNFLPYKDACQGREGVLVATGPTFKDYDYAELNDGNRVVVAVNSAFMDLRKAPDYYFFGHVDRRSLEYLPRVRDLKCTKFGFTRVDGRAQPTCLSDAMATHLGAIPFGLSTVVRFEQDLSVHPLVDHAINFPALQFMIWSGMRRIYLVGCDVTAVTSHRDPSIDKKRLVGNMLSVWKHFKTFAERMKTEIIVVNPVGLKGMFGARVC